MQIIIPRFGGCRETCCEITNINSNNLLKTRNYPNCAPTPVWRMLKRTILHYTWWRRRTRWNEESTSRVYVTSKWKKHPEWEGGYQETRKSARSWYEDQKRYGIEIVIESLLRDRTVSWVRIVNGIDKYVTETAKTISLENVEHTVTVKSVATAKPRPMPTLTLSPISIPVRERNWIDSNPERFRPDCFPVSKAWSDHCDMIHQFLEEMMG